MTDPLGERLVEEGLITPAQLKTAVEFQQSLGGNLKQIVVKLGYVEEKTLRSLAAQVESSPGTSEGLDERRIDLEAAAQLPRPLLEKHLALPLQGSGSSLVLAMANPNDFNAIEEIQFLVDRRLEVVPGDKAAIERALGRLDALIAQGTPSGTGTAEGAPAPKAKPAKPGARRAAPTQASKRGQLRKQAQGKGKVDPAAVLGSLPLEQLIRAHLLVQIEQGELSLTELLAQVERLPGGEGQ